MTAEEFRVAVGAEIRRRREKAGLSQEQLSARVGIHRNSLIAYEGGRTGRSMTSDMLYAVCLALGTTPEMVMRQAQKGE